MSFLENPSSHASALFLNLPKLLHHQHSLSSCVLADVASQAVACSLAVQQQACCTDPTASFTQRVHVKYPEGLVITLCSFYLLSPKHCHAFVGYLEEEAVKTCEHPDMHSCLKACPL